MGLLNKLMFWKRGDEFENVGLGEKGDLPKMDLGLGPEFGAGHEPSQGMPQTPGMPNMQQSSSPETPSFQQQTPSFQQQPQFNPVSSQPGSGYDPAAKNMEVISSKLDAVRASLDSINQRLANLEAIARGEEEQRYRGRW